MDEEEKAVNRKTWLVMGIILLLAVVGAGIYYILHQKKQMDEMSQMFALEKEALSDEYEELSLQYEGYKFSVGNDSLVALLTTEQAKVQRLQEELRTVKSTNARRISELKKELETLRKVMRNYVIQIDSLNAENRQLKDENHQVTQKYQQAASAAARLTKEKEQLTERVAMAAKLDAVNIQVSLLNAKGKAAKGLGKATQLMLSFIVSKNITAAVGEQTIYVRLMRPDDDILTKPNSGRFMFENKEITYSMKKQIEYDGEEQHVVMYWNIEEFLSAGNYRVDIFTEGNLMGRKSFMLEK
jgi:predicted  nucleic acid-binding Zn-ribbon protein